MGGKNIREKQILFAPTNIWETGGALNYWECLLAIENLALSET